MLDGWIANPGSLSHRPTVGSGRREVLAMPSLRLVARQVADLQSRIDACIELFRTHPRLGWQQSGETDLHRRCAAGLWRTRRGKPSERGLSETRPHSIALEEATLLARLRSEADFAERTGRDATRRGIASIWHRSANAWLGLCNPPKANRRASLNGSSLLTNGTA